MVKTGGRLIPDLLNKDEREVLPEKMKMLHDICFSCYPACTAIDPNDDLGREFMADAIISNPVTIGHVHVAMKLNIPLHIMFPQPWSDSHSFIHFRLFIYFLFGFLIYCYSFTEFILRLLFFKIILGIQQNHFLIHYQI